MRVHLIHYNSTAALATMSHYGDRPIQLFDLGRLLAGLKQVTEYAQDRFSLVLADDGGRKDRVEVDRDDVLLDAAERIKVEASISRREALNHLTPYIRLRMGNDGTPEHVLDVPSDVQSAYDAALIAIEYIATNAYAALIGWSSEELVRAGIIIAPPARAVLDAAAGPTNNAVPRNPLIPKPPSLWAVLGYLWVGRRKVGITMLCALHALAAVAVFKDVTLAIEYLLFWGVVLVQRDAWSRQRRPISLRIAKRRRRITRLLLATIIFGTIVGCALKIIGILNDHTEAHPVEHIAECVLHGTFHLLLAFLLEYILDDIFGNE